MEIEKRIAIDTAIEKEVVKKVIEHSLDCLLRSSEKNESLEITGFGNFYLKKNRIPAYAINLGRKIDKFKVHLTTLTNKSSIKNLEGRIEKSEKMLIGLKKKYGLE